MRFTSLTVESFKAIRSAHLEFGPRLNVLYGPNDLGKSTLITALRAALLVPTRSTEAEQYFPWYADSAPTVTLSFTTDDEQHWRVEKRFGPHDHALLSFSKEGRDWVVDAKGRQVEEKVRRLIDLGIPSPGSKGAPKGLPRSFLTNALLAGQTEVDTVLREGLELDPADSGKVRLTKALAALGQDRLFKQVLDHAASEVDQFFTPKGQRKRTRGSKLVLASEAVKSLSAELAEVQAQLQDSAAVEQQAEALRQRRGERVGQLELAEQARSALREAYRASRGRAAVEDALVTARAALSAIEAHAARVATLGQHLLELDSTARALETDHRAAQALAEVATRDLQTAEEALRHAQRADGRAQRELERSRQREALAKLGSRKLELDAARTQVTEAKARVERAQSLAELVKTLGAEAARHAESLEGLQRQLTEAEAQVSLAEGAVAYGRWRVAAAAVEQAAASKIEAGQLRTQAIAKTTEAFGLDTKAKALEDEATASLSALPDERKRAELVELEHDLHVAEAALGGGVSVTVRPRKEVALRSTVDENKAVDETRVKGEREFEADRRVTLSFGDLVEVEIITGSAERRRHFEALKRRWRTEAVPLLEQHGVLAPAELAARVTQAERLRQEAKDKRAQAANIRREGDALLARATHLEQQVQAAPTKSDVDARKERIGTLDLAGLEHFVSTLGSDWEATLESLKGQTVATVKAVTAQREKLTRERDRALDRRDEAAARVRELGVVEPLDADPNALETEWRATVEAARALEATLGETEDETDAEVEQAKRGVAKAQAALAAATSSVATAEQALAQARASLQTKRGEHAALAAHLEGLDRARAAARVEALEGERQAVAAIRLVSDAELEQAELAVRQAKAALDEANEAFHLASGRLSAVGGPALRERGQQLEEALTLARAREHELETEADAWRLLHEALREAENTEGAHLGRALAAPVAERFGELTGGRYTGLTVDTALRTTGVDVRGVAAAGEAVLDALSVGTRDQLATLVRLSVAASLKSAIILDDHLVHTDPSRLSWFNEVLRSVAQDAQVLVFTCRPNDYLSARERKDAAGAVRALNLEQLVQSWPARTRGT